jgi:ankyrin repeat protein
MLPFIGSRVCGGRIRAILSPRRSASCIAVVLFVRLLFALGGCASGPPRLHAAIANQQTEEALRLIHDSKNLEETDEAKQTPLHYAANIGPTEVVDALLERGANVHARRNDGATPLILACLSGKLLVVEKLLANGSQITEKNNAGADCLYVAAAGSHIESGRHGNLLNR